MKKIYIGAGHGSGDPGACAFGYQEQQLMSWLRDEVSAGLTYRGADVTTDGFGNVNESLLTALELIKDSGAEVCIEFHLNAGPEAAHGVECLSLESLKDESQKIAQTISRVLGETQRGVFGWKDQTQSAHGRLAFVNAGGIIVEVFFLTNKKSLDNYLLKKQTLVNPLVETIYRIAQE